MPYRDIEKRRSYGRDWMRRNPEKAREAMRRWRQAHPVEHSKETRDFYARHKDRIDARRLAYRRARPEVKRAADHRRRARALGASGSFTAAQWREVLRQYGGRCAYCGAPSASEADHRIPLARGGGNGIDNILPACGRCNARKHTMTESEFLIREYGGKLDGTGLVITSWHVVSPTTSAFELAADK